MSFHVQLAIGKAGESQIAQWLQSRGNYVLPVYEKEFNEYKGPVLFRPDGSQLICPDLLAISKTGMAWIEAKHKSAFTWHRNTQRWVTGIDIHHYRQYLHVANELPRIQVWLLFLHRVGSVAKDTPDGMVSPTGLYGGQLLDLASKENHRHQNWGKTGMVYWAHDKLTKLADLEEFEERSAIMEYDAGMSRRSADFEAKKTIALGAST